MIPRNTSTHASHFKHMGSLLILLALNQRTFGKSCSCCHGCVTSHRQTPYPKQPIGPIRLCNLTYYQRSTLPLRTVKAFMHPRWPRPACMMIPRKRKGQQAPHDQPAISRQLSLQLLLDSLQFPSLFLLHPPHLAPLFPEVSSS